MSLTLCARAAFQRGSASNSPARVLTCSFAASQECPLLNAEFAAHFIGGAQNGAPDSPRDDRYMLSALTAKHFSMYLDNLL